MYPNLYYAFKDLFGIDLPGLRLVNTFGFFVALAFIASAWVLTLELRRKENLGQFSYTEEDIVIGKPAGFSELLTNFLLGFIFGFKIIGAFFIDDALNDPQAFILSGRGSLPFGLLLGGISAFLKWREKNRQKLEKPEKRVIRIWPHDRVGDFVIYAAAFGFLGAKIFHNLENWNDFVKDPVGSLVSFSGLTFYGGLICAGIAIIWYARKHRISVIHLCDAMAPTMMFAYAAGRIGCQVSGDGDWGIVNLRPKPFSWLPDWMWAYHYPHNVVGDGQPIPGCTGPYCNQLVPPVYPTPLYEIIACFILFFVLWYFRKRMKIAGQISGLYLILNGVERFFIEKIRVNTHYEGLPFQPTQAELISLIMVIGGVLLLVKAKDWFGKQTPALK
ncbi:prolipoprotein diacylglyceryl transferase [Sediminibacterium ginsengisoli]|nr:prolipoprotein diacylglyceryl transferase family protein [Sediminibacterium ginsengisoli]